MSLSPITPLSVNHGPWIRAMFKSTSKVIRRHNDRFPESIHGKACSHRLKQNHQKTAQNAVRLWAKHWRQAILNGATVVTNEFPANRRTLRQMSDLNYGSKSGTVEHLARLAYAGVILGEQETDAQPFQEAVYRAKNKGGKGHGWRPLKRFCGSNRDFKLLLAPSLIPVALLASVGVVFVEKMSFEADPVADQAADARPAASSPKRQNLTHINSPIETNRNEEISAKALPAATSAVPDGNNEESHPRAKRAAAAQRDPKAATEGGTADAGTNPEISSQDGGAAPSAAEAPISAPEDLAVSSKPSNWLEEFRNRRAARNAKKAPLLSLTDAQRLLIDGQNLEVSAKMLVESYQKKLIPAMERQPYHPKEIEKGIQSAKHLLMTVSPLQLDGFLERLFLTIDHIAHWLTLDPYNFVMPPSVWFDPKNQKSGILNAERKYLRIYESRAAEFENQRAAIAQKQKEAFDEEAKLAQTDNFYYFAFQFKRYLMKAHPEDTRIRTSNLEKWTLTLRRMVRRDYVTLDHFGQVAEWFFDSEDKEAVFWRHKAGESGIRSMGGFRRHFWKIHEQMTKAQLKAQNLKETPVQKTDRW